MDVITTHVNADFDCLGAMVAAKKLYPDALMVFSVPRKRHARLLPEVHGLCARLQAAEDVDVSSVTRLYSLTASILRASEDGRGCLAAGVDVHIYDHHPDIRGDLRLPGAKSANAVLPRPSCRILMERVLRYPCGSNPVMLGIHEIRAILSFPPPRGRLSGLGVLLEMGATLIRERLHHPGTDIRQVSLLNDLLKSLKKITIDVSR